MSETLSAARLALAAEQARAATGSLDLIAAEPVAIIGIGCRFPGAVGSPAEFFEMLLSGRDAVGPVPASRFDADAFYSAGGPTPGRMATRMGAFLDDIERFDAAFFGIAPKEAAAMDPQQRHLLEVAWEALEDAGVPAPRLTGSRTGVFAAVYNHDYLRYQYADPARVEAYTSSGTAYAIAAGRLAFLWDLRGPALVIDTACSSSLVATHLACASLRARECDLAIVGAAGLVLGPETNISLSQYGMLAPDGRCKTFDAAADGFGRGEGCGVVILKRLADALGDGDRVRAVIRGSALNQDGRSTALTAPSGLAQLDLIRAATAAARVDAAQVGYVEAHGTGTPLGDPIEVEALIGALGAAGQPCALASAKANVGHLEAASGVVGLIKAALVLERGVIPPAANFHILSPHINLDGTRFFVPTAATPFTRGSAPRLAGVSAFGFSGTNAHVILEEPPHLDAEPAARGEAERILCVSAADDAGLRRRAQAFADRLAVAQDHELDDICYTAAVRRTHHDHRLAVVAATAAQMGELLRAFAAGRAAAGVIHDVRHAAAQSVFVFSGQGPQWWGMGRELRHEQPVFRDALATCADAIDAYASFALLDELSRDEEHSRLRETEVAQPALFALQVALVALWRSWGVVPAAVIGHSLGEIAAAHTAGFLDLGAAARLVVIRGRLMQKLTGRGRMASVEAGEAEVERFLKNRAEVVIAARNTPDSTVISGEPDAVAAVVSAAAAAGVVTTMLPVDYAFHSHQVQPLAGELRAQLAGLPASVPAVPLYSTVTGARLHGAVDAGYWARNMAEPVAFAAALAAAFAAGATTFVEIGPHAVLAPAVARCARGADVSAVPSLRRGRPEMPAMLQALGAVHARGGAVDWRAVQSVAGRVVDLPTYSWSETRFAVPTWATLPRTALPSATPAHPLLGAARPLPPPRSGFDATLKPAAPAFLADHRFGGQVVAPAAAFVEMGLASARAIFGNDGAVVIDVTFEEALGFAGDETAAVHVMVERTGDEAARFEIHSRVDDGPWRRHARGGLAARAARAVCRDGAPPPAAVTRMAGDRFYESLAPIGPEFGASFRCVAEAAIEPDTAWARIAAPAAVMAEMGAYVFHPALLDGCFQLAGMVPGVPRPGADEVLVPVALASLVVHAPGVPPNFAARASLRSAQAGVATVDIDVLDDTQRMIAAIRGLALRPVPRAALAARTTVDDWLCEMAFRPAPRGPRVCADVARVLLLAGEADGALVRDALRARGVETIVESAAPAGAAPAGVVMLVLPESPVATDTPAGVLQALVRDAGERAMAAIRAAETQRPAARLVLVTRGAQSVVGEPVEWTAAAHAGLWGLRNVVALERPELQATIVDLDPGPLSGGAAAELAEELTQWDGETQLGFRGGLRHAARLARARMAAVAAPARLRVGQPGVLDSLTAAPATRRPPGRGELEIAVAATGLNFRDVLKALGTYPGGAGELPDELGDECAGVVAAVGAGVEGVRVGDRVMAFYPGSFATHVTGPASMAVPVPEALSLEEAAAIPVAFLTAAYALEELGGVAAGDCVLIHAGAGGVGAAALQVARRRGATVIATAGSEAKRAWLREQGVALALDSRTLAFADEVLAFTGGRGADVVLNSLAGDFIAASLRALRAGGIFLEIGRTGIWTAERVAALGRDIRYHVVFLADQRRADPEILGQQLRALARRFDAGELQAPPIRVFAAGAAAAAFRTMAQARHVGKLVVRQQAIATDTALSPDCTWLVTGAFGGLGLLAAEALIARGARSLLLLGRRAPDGAASARIEQWRRGGADVATFVGDVADSADIERLRQALARRPRLGGVVHAAGALDDALLADLRGDRWDGPLAAKVAGTWNLMRLADVQPEAQFIGYSAGAALLGSVGQGNYAAANAAMDALLAARRSRGRTGLAIQWGAWSEVGMAARLDSTQRRRIEARGLACIDPRSGAAVLARLLAWPWPAVAVLPAQWHVVAAQGVDAARFVSELAAGRVAAVAAAPVATGLELARALGAAAPARRRALARERIHGFAQRALGLGPNVAIDGDKALRDLGLDSLMAVELRNTLGVAMGTTFPATLLFEHPTINALASVVLGMIDGAAAATELAALSDQDVETLLAAELARGGPS